MLHRRWFVALAFTLLVGRGAPPCRADGPPARIEIHLDVSEVPDLKAWGEKAKQLCERWHPRIMERLQLDGVAPKPITLIFSKDMKGVAATSGATIRVSAEWVRKHPDDFGMVIHEMTHVIQAYPKPEPIWLTEGIADHVRYYYFEPNVPRPRLGPKSSYRDGYGTTAAFLAWLENTHDKKLVIKLNRAMRAGTYKPELFKEWTGKDVDGLWSDFVKSQKK